MSIVCHSHRQHTAIRWKSNGANWHGDDGENLFNEFLAVVVIGGGGVLHNDERNGVNENITVSILSLLPTIHNLATFFFLISVVSFSLHLIAILAFSSSQPALSHLWLWAVISQRIWNCSELHMEMSFNASDTIHTICVLFRTTARPRIVHKHM